MDLVVRFVLYLNLFIISVYLPIATNASTNFRLEDERCWMYNMTIESTFNNTGKCKFMSLVLVNISQPSRELFDNLAGGLELFTLSRSNVRLIYLPSSLKNFRFVGGSGYSTQIIVNEYDSYALENFYSEKLSQLPINLEKLHSLKVLECFAAYREKIDFNKFTQMVQLEQINLVNIAGVSISDTLELPLLQKLSISDSPIEFVNNASCNFPLLEQLYLTNNSLQEIPKHLSSFANLKAYCVAKNKLGSVNFDFLTKMELLEDLSLTKNHISAIITEHILELPRLRTIHLYDNKLTELNVTLWAMSALQYLSLENNQLKQLPGLLTLFTGKVQNVQLNENPWDCAWLREAAQKISTLKPIVIRYCILGTNN